MSRYGGGQVLGDESRMQETIDYWWSHFNAEAYRWCQDYITGRVFEIGCNIGMACLLAAQDPRVEHVYGFDVNPRAIESAIRYRDFLGFQEKITYHVHDFAGYAPMWDELEWCFDAAMCFHTLEHIFEQDLERFLQNIWGMLEPSGYFLVSVPRGTAHNSPNHVTRFTMASLIDLVVQSADFTLADRLDQDNGNILTGLFFR